MRQQQFILMFRNDGFPLCEIPLVSLFSFVQHWAWGGGGGGAAAGVVLKRRNKEDKISSLPNTFDDDFSGQR